MAAPSGPPAPDASSFDAFYFAHCCGRPYGRDPELLRFFGTVADRIISDIGAGRVLDAGCAFGLLVEALRERHLEASGIDLSPYAISQTAAAAAPYCRVGSLADPIDGRFDLVVCIEVVEHMPPAEADRAIANICACTDDVLFSSSPFDHREPTHVNLPPPEAWAEAFAQHGFYRDPDFDASFVTSWAVRYRRSAEPVPRLVRALERRFSRAEIALNESRAHAIEIQKHAEGVERQEAAALARVAHLEAALAASDAASAIHAAEAQALAQRLAAAEDRAAHIERSIFWKMRGAWVKANRLMGRRR